MSLRQIKIPVFRDERGVLAALEVSKIVDWKIERVYFVLDCVMPRGGHSVRGEKKIYICQKGSVKARFHDTTKWVEYQMNGPDDAIVLDEPYYREFVDFSPDAVLLAISSIPYLPNQYIYVLDDYIDEFKNGINLISDVV